MKKRRSKKFVQVKNARTEDYRKVLKKIEKGDHCPFCKENFLQHHKKPILFTTEHWVVTENSWPYTGAEKHYLLITARHIITLTDLTNSEWQNLLKCIKRLEDISGFKRGTLIIRYGDPEYSGGTVDHLHPHLVVAKSKEEKVITRI